MVPVIVALSPVNALAQCSIASFSIESGCGTVDPIAHVDLQGGALPYQLTFTAANGQVSQTESWQQGLVALTLIHWPQVQEPPVTLVVTDAQGCTATASGWFTIHGVAEQMVWLETPCGGSDGYLHFSGSFRLAGSPWGADPCGGALAYRVMNWASSSVMEGPLSTDWSEVAPGIWRFNTALPPATYDVLIYTQGAPEGCFNGIYWCYAPAVVQVQDEPSNCGIMFSLSAALGGALPSGSLMTDGLRSNGLVPTTEPYTALGYTYVGSPTLQAIGPGVLQTTGASAIVDWVVVELRSVEDPSTVVFSKPALIQRNGLIRDVAWGAIRAPVPAARYHVAVRHRNHLGVMTAVPLWLGHDAEGGWSSIDLRSASTGVYGTAARMAVGSVQCLWPGDASGSHRVSYVGAGNDRDVVLQAIGGSVPTNVVDNVYDRRDVNLDGRVMYVGDGNDRDVILQSIGGTVPTAVRVQQLP